MKSLIIYYSRTGTTRKIAEVLQEKLGADIEEISSQKYNLGAFGYIQGGKDAMRKKPGDIRERKRRLADYDLVIIGGPIWGWNVCPPVRAYCREAKGALKRIAYFCTMGGSGYEKAFAEMEKECGCKPIATLNLTTKEVMKDEFKAKLEEFVLKLQN